jgi:hypothetical protein
MADRYYIVSGNQADVAGGRYSRVTLQMGDYATEEEAFDEVRQRRDSTAQAEAWQNERGLLQGELGDIKHHVWSEETVRAADAAGIYVDGIEDLPD